MNFNIKKLIKLLNADTQSLLTNPNKYWDGNIQIEKGYLYMDRGSKVLGVAHLDTVADDYNSKDGKRKVFKPLVEDMGVNDKMITSMKLDDRLGVFLLMDVFPYLGLRYDVLLTSDEEIGMSTASQFVTKKEYNWIFEMDRRGYGTAVLYQYDSPKIRTALSSLDYKIEIGSFSDICELDTLGCVAINFGCGYNYEHTNACSVRTSWLSVVVNMFVDFYRTYSDTLFEYFYTTPKSKYGSKYGSYRGSYGGYYNDSDYDDDGYRKSLPVPVKSHKEYIPESGMWREILSDRYDDEIAEVTIEPTVLDSHEIEIIPVDENDYTCAPIYKNGVQITAYRIEANGDWTPMGTDGDGDYYVLGEPIDKYMQDDIACEAIQQEIKFDKALERSYCIPALDDDDEFDNYVKYDSRAKNPKDFLHPEDFEEIM